MASLDAAVCSRVNNALQAWRQGDCVVGEQWLVFRTDMANPLTANGAVATPQNVDTAESRVPGLMVVTQTCDIVRSCDVRPFVQVCPLIRVCLSLLREVWRSRRPNYAFIASLAEQQLVADLDRMMTVEKSVVAGWSRVAGCQTKDDARRLSFTLARKYARVAFPDDFTRFVRPLMQRMSSKHDKSSDEGQALRALREIRVKATPSWNAKTVGLAFVFIRNESNAKRHDPDWDRQCEAWLARVKPSGRFTAVDGLVQTLDDLTARDYVESDPLDLDHLSSRDNT